MAEQVVPPQIQEMNPHPDTHVIGVRFEKLGKLYHFDYSEFPDIALRDYVIVDTARGLHMGQVMGFSEREGPDKDYKPVLRPASGRDMMLHEHWKNKGVEVLIDLREIAADMGGYKDVKWVEAAYNFDGSHLTVMYSTEEDVDITAVRQAFNVHVGMGVEFRRIGPREVARRLGGQGACGIPRCCSTFLTDFSPISIKMAKAQNIPLNPSEITGMCGRLRCCLLYEYEQYVEARKHLPRRNKRIGTPYGEAKVADVHPIRDGVSIYQDKQRVFIPREDIIPLDEFRALKEKAAQGCTKNESGGCDCGAYRPKSASADLKEALDSAHQQTTAEDETSDDATGDQAQRRGKRGRRGRRGSSRKRDEDSQQAKKDDSPGGKKRRRNRRKGKNKNNRSGKNNRSK